MSGGRGWPMKSNEFGNLIKHYSDLLENLLNSKHLSLLDENLTNMLPRQGGVYCISDKTDNMIIYIGQSKDLQKRIYRNHLMGSQRNSTLRRKIIIEGKYFNEDQVRNYLHEQCMAQFIEIEDEFKRKFFEHFAIAMLKPKYNN
jgi:excinuclease UvrABC nuclease subunit